MNTEKNIRAYAAWVAICITWGTTYLAIRIGVKDLPPVVFAGLRWIIAGTFLLVVLLLRGYKLPKRKDLIPLTIVALCLLGIGNGFVVFGEQYLPSGLAALLITTVPFWIVVIEFIMPHGKKINYLTVIGILLGFIGIILIFGNDLGALFHGGNIKGVIGLMIADFGWAVGSVYSKYKKIDAHPLVGAAVEMIIAGIVLSILALFLGEFTHLSFTTNSLLAFGYLIVFGSLFGYTFYIYAIAHLPVSFVSTYAYINPIIALFLGWLILDESITANIIFAAFIILVGVMLVKKGSDKTNS